jgi:multidrug efflux system outer membrane protein
MVGLATIVACDPVGPNYARPKTDIPEAFAEAGPWKEALPQDTIARGDWWAVFGDPLLNDLQAETVRQSPDLKAAAARVLQAQAVAGISRSYLYPEVNAGALGQRFANNSNATTLVDPGTITENSSVITFAYKAMPLWATYEIDFWGRVRRMSEQAQAEMQASIAAYQTAMLSLNGEVAQTYFEIRTTDELLRLIDENIGVHRATFELFKSRTTDGLTSDVALLDVQTSLRTIEAQAQALHVRRAQLVNKLAVLTGTIPEGFVLAKQPLERPLERTVPGVPVGLPSDLLQRRPDIAAAERELAASNAKIGVAVAAYFPNVSLTSGVGFEAFAMATVANPTANIWGVGFTLFQSLFNAGRIGLNVERTRAVYEEKVALYQGVLLKAFQEVETALASLSLLERQARFQQEAVDSASRTATLASQRFQQGLNSQLDVLIARRALIASQSIAVQIDNERLGTTVSLIKALGGGWQGRAVPEGSRSMWAPALKQ